jgi:hypothetical protein|tara:strand:- start:5023 stop:5232 length:210 start_codon:yes stop_codon:yes gene_type:complete
MKRFYVRFAFGQFKVIDRETEKVVTSYSKKADAESTAKGLCRIRKVENITKMMGKLKTLKGYSHYLTSV